MDKWFILKNEIWILPPWLIPLDRVTYIKHFYQKIQDAIFFAARKLSQYDQIASFNYPQYSLIQNPCLGMYSLYFLQQLGIIGDYLLCNHMDNSVSLCFILSFSGLANASITQSDTQWWVKEEIRMGNNVKKKNQVMLQHPKVMLKLELQLTN